MIAALIAMAADVLATIAGFIVLCLRVAEIHRRTTQGLGGLARRFGKEGSDITGVQLPWKVRFAFFIGEHYRLVLFVLVLALIGVLATFMVSAWAAFRRQSWVRGVAIAAAVLSFVELEASPAFIPAIVIGVAAAALLWFPGPKSVVCRR